jgi:FixJ family two-component response regulator
MPTATVYIVDDDPSMRGALARLVRSAGLPVESFASAEEFLAAVDVKARAFLVLDARLTGMSGLELLACMAERASTIPVAIITAVDDGQVELDALRAGAMAFLRKPFDPQSLLDTIARGLDGSAATDGSA